MSREPRDVGGLVEMTEDQRQMSCCLWSEGGGTSDRLEEEVVYCEQRVL